jgi:hypothetical protein
MKRVVSYGGGVDSTAMTLLLLERGEKPDLVVFCDTGGEYPETYAYLDRFDAYLRERAQVGVTRIQAKEGPMYEYMLARGWTPSRLYPSHIDRWKIRPILRYCQEWRRGEPVEMCIGIDYDERDRMADPRRKFITNRYPLVDAGVGRRGAERMIREAGLPLPIKSGCFFCPYQQKARWLWAKREHPDKFAAARRLEESGNFFPKKTLFWGGPLAKIDDLIDGQETLDMACSAAGMCGA